jgi:multidrug transporter EmrE-like cation transporter
MGYFYLSLNIVLTVACQIALKWRLNHVQVDFSNIHSVWHSTLQLARDLWIVGAVAGTLVSSFLWILTLSKLELSVAYPFSVLSYVAVVVISHFFLNEQLTIFRLVGVLLICVGILMIAKK